MKIEIGKWDMSGEPEYNGVSIDGTVKECIAFIKLCIENGFEDMDGFPVSPLEINHFVIKGE